jgi:hypothetical protein
MVHVRGYSGHPCHLIENPCGVLVFAERAGRLNGLVHAFLNFKYFFAVFAFVIVESHMLIISYLAAGREIIPIYALRARYR